MPSDKGPAVEAPWWAMKGEWDKAHECVQAHEGELDCDAVHAHLHRQESDLSNADYWYRRAGRPISTASLEEARDLLVAEFLTRS